MRLFVVWEDDRPRGGGSGVGGSHRILHWLRDVRDCRAAVAAGSAELGTSLSCQVLQQNHSEKEQIVSTAFLERTKVSTLPFAFADINIDESRFVYFWLGDQTEIRKQKKTTW
jgi:hypothetical protein